MKQKYGIPTADLMRKMMRTRNPVTRSELARIIGDRIDRVTDRQE